MLGCVRAEQYVGRMYSMATWLDRLKLLYYIFFSSFVGDFHPPSFIALLDRITTALLKEEEAEEEKKKKRETTCLNRTTS